VSRTEQRPVIRHHAFFREGAGATRVPLTRGAHIRVCAEHARTAVWCSNTHGLRRTAVVTRAAAAAAQVPAPADEGPSLLKNLSLAFDGNCRVRTLLLCSLLPTR
jgi:hypothetical protein